MALTTRTGKGSKLTIQEMDDNLTYLDSGTLYSISEPTEGSSIVYRNGAWRKSARTTTSVSPSLLTQLGTRPIDLLPTPGEGLYYRIDHVLFEYIYRASDYTLNPACKYLYISLGPLRAMISPSLITDTGDKSIIVSRFESGIDPTENVSYVQAGEGDTVLNQPLVLTTWDGYDPAGGGGTLGVTVHYTLFSR